MWRPCGDLAMELPGSKGEDARSHFFHQWGG
jgi:hypothetical protein